MTNSLTEDREARAHDVRVEYGTTYQGRAQQELTTGQAYCLDCDWEGPTRVSDPDDAQNDAQRHRDETATDHYEVTRDA